jgi:hypothetical protein
VRDIALGLAVDALINLFFSVFPNTGRGRWEHFDLPYQLLTQVDPNDY